MKIHLCVQVMVYLLPFLRVWWVGVSQRDLHLPFHFSSPPSCTYFFLLLAGVRTLELEREKCLAIVVSWLPLLLQSRLVFQYSSCSRNSSAGSQVDSCVSLPVSPDYPFALMPLKREIYSELSFYSALKSCSWWNRHMLWFTCMMANSSGWQNSKLMQAKLIFTVHLSLQEFRCPFSSFFLPGYLALCNYLPFSHFPCSHKHIGG